MTRFGWDFGGFGLLRTASKLDSGTSAVPAADCYDNAVAERFFLSLKHKWTKHESFANLEEARLSVFKCIDVFYNRQRLHQSLGYKTPEQYEAENAPATAA